MIRFAVIVPALGCALLGAGCDPHPQSYVVVDNAYPPSSARALVVYQAFWQAVAFPNAIPPGSSSGQQPTVPASDNTAYAVLAPGWDPASSTPPTEFVVVQSWGGFDVHLNDTVHIPVDDTTFTGNCAAGSTLTQDQADFITRLVFPGVFAATDARPALHYDAATCTTTPVADSGTP
jgi:hypothetical protein